MAASVDGTVAEGSGAEGEPRATGLADRIRAAEVDGRLVGMIVALAGIWILFQYLSGGTFLSARNLYNLSVQMATVGIMATGMVFIIVTRNIDLSVGSMMGFVGMVMALLQAEILPPLLGFGNPMIWVITLAIGIVLGASIGALQGSIVAYFGVPAFVVTLGGLLVWRGAAFVVSTGRTIAPMDPTFRRMGGGANGALFGTGSWLLAVLLCVGLMVSLVMARQQRRRFSLDLRPMWAEVTIAVIGCAAVLATTAVLTSYYLPEGLAVQWAEARGISWPEGGLLVPVGFAFPVVIMLTVGLVMTYLANRRAFGRYVYAIGGNPEAAKLGGINTRWVTVKVFMLMGVLVAIAAAVAIGRQNSGTVQLGTLSELYVIAAAVIGGTSLAGGIGTVPGAMLGALVMQSLQSGMVLTGVDSPQQQIVVGIALVLAVGLDATYRRRSA